MRDDADAGAGRRAPRARRSCLAVPGSSARMLEKAAGLPADEIILDLEDAVAADVKADARALIVEALREHDYGTRVRAVRINAVVSPWALRDLLDAVGPALGSVDVVMVPKVEEAGEVAFVDHVLAQLEAEQDVAIGSVGLEVQVESARGLAAIHSVLAASRRIEAVVLGPGDMAASLGMPSVTVGDVGRTGDDPWTPILTAVLLAARAHGLQAVDGPYARLDDPEGLRVASQRARVLGYDGKWAIHPSQLEALNEIFGVEQAVFERAHDLLDAHTAGATAGRGAVRFGAEMIDEASRRMAEANLARGRAAGMRPRPTPVDLPVEERAAWRDAHV